MAEAVAQPTNVTVCTTALWVCNVLEQAPKPRKKTINQSLINVLVLASPSRYVSSQDPRYCSKEGLW